MEFDDSEPRYEPRYVISVAARMLGLHAQTLRYYERAGMVEPSRSAGNRRLYSTEDIERLRRVKTLVDDLGVNLAGVEVIMRMSERMVEMERQMRRLERDKRDVAHDIRSRCEGRDELSRATNGVAGSGPERRHYDVRRTHGPEREQDAQTL